MLHPANRRRQIAFLIHRLAYALLRLTDDALQRRVSYCRVVTVSDECVRARIIDAAFVVISFGVQVGGAVALRNHDPDRTLDPWGLVLIGAAPLVLWWRRRFPVAVLLAVFSLTLAYDLTDQPRGPIWLALSIAFVTVMMAGRRLVAWSVLVVGYATFLGPGHAAGAHPSVIEIVGLSAWILLLGAGAEAARSGRDHHLERARAREEHARRKASEERLAIARDLHDVLAHHVALISVQSGVALHLLDDHPEQARPALTAIRQASSEVLRELRGALDLLRAGEASARQPAPDLHRVADLVDGASVAGLRVEVTTRGDVDAVPDVISIAAFRVIQEAITNVVRHAGATVARVRIEVTPSKLAIRIDDDGQGLKETVGPAVGGSGLLGMRERAAALGGHVFAGPSCSGGSGGPDGPDGPGGPGGPGGLGGFSVLAEFPTRSPLAAISG